tara:strand:- start:3614 stop:5320 length:1707 start_codon:yes stop_codon:yes gene_type:complete
MRDIMRAFSDSRFHTIVGVTASQMGKTELLLNIVGHRFSDGPYYPGMYVGPTEKNVRSMSNDRFKDLFKYTPILKKRLEKGHADKVTEKFINGVRFGFAWAGSETELSAFPCGFVLMDERDRMNNDVQGKGDPVEIVRGRMKNFPNKKLGVFSTPTLEGASPIIDLFEQGTMMKWAWPCPHCAEFFIPELSNLWWPEKATPREAFYKAEIICPECAAGIKHAQKMSMQLDAKYLPHKLGQDGQHIRIEKPIDSGTASFMVNGLCSPWRSFGESAELMVQAYRSKSQEKIQSVINVEFGQTFKISGDAPEYESVLECNSPYKPGDRPRGVQLITLGVDVQEKGLYYVIRGWGYLMESWLLRYGYIDGDTDYDDPWLILRRVSQEMFNEMPINLGLIDSGYRANKVYAFCRTHKHFLYPSKGHATQDRPVKIRDIDITQSGRTIKNGVRLYHVDTDYLKTWIHSRIRSTTNGEEYGFHLHEQTTEEYARQIVAEEVVQKPSGHRVWIMSKKGADNHYFDCECYALAAALSLQAHALQPIEEVEEADKKTVGQSQVPENTFINAPSNFFRR